MKSKILFLVKPNVPPFQFALRDGNCFLLAGKEAFISRCCWCGRCLEEPHFHALGLVSALNGDSLSITPGPPWCCLWRQWGCWGWRVGAGMSSAGGIGVVSIEELCYSPVVPLGEHLQSPLLALPPRHDWAPVQTLLNSDCF